MEMYMLKEPNGYHRDYSPAMMSSCSSSSSAIGFGYIQHSVSKLDTLAGIAIKYGVEVADIRRLNGLVTDSQMFALKTLHIPPLGRNSNDNSPSHIASHELLEPFQSPVIKSSEKKLSSALNSSSQCYYGSVPAMKESIREILEIALSRQVSSNSSEKGSFYTNRCVSDRPQGDWPKSRHKTSRSLAERNFIDNLESYDKWDDMLAKNLEDDLKSTPELLMRKENSSSCRLSSRTGKGLAQRQRVVSRIALNVGDSFTIDGVSSSVRKSSSTSCLQGNNSSIYVRPTSRRTLKPDFFGSTANLPKPILSGSRNKAALD